MKNKVYLSVLSFCILLSAGCNLQNAKNHKQTPAREDMFVSGGGIGDLIHPFETFEDRLTYSDAIVYGEVTDFEMYSEEISAFIGTFETIHVIETLYGDIEPGTDIILREDGGYVHVRDYINAFVTEEERTGYREGMFGRLTDEELDTKYISEVPEGYYYPEIGDRAVYCLKHSEKIEGVFFTPGGYQGKYRELEDGLLAAPSSTNSITDPDKTYRYITIRYDDLKEKIQEAAEKQ